ncbi:concanavalin A-like lectin/glucanase domain-containing protein [Gamsiella multidivaricata]|uniref:concanavalin A-like lectin/glucanase domain-containing protein n=1 Tax=Gamsiella multidivaricata TaxID=101098 RepID=UPI00221E69B0|nr:concanavalin A-like lectin/glucanase domain-containing protein [Gamsiella multidivaricata]KAI7831608.1 concanavalin A-like lectin/glucanase domain-containing protein [Gamsiella multidivaricata]
MFWQRFSGPGRLDSDASAVRANRPIPPQCGVYYYEVYVKSKGQQGYIGIGVCNPMVALDRLPGWEPQSWGYHGDDGNSFGGCGSGRPFGPVFTTGDTIGCGINFRDMSLFYTKNGTFLGVAFRDLKGPLYPTVGMRTAGEIVEANFGQQEFVFNIEDYVKDEKVEAWQALENSLQNAVATKNHIGTLSQNLSQLVLSYMVHHGYSESAKQFSNDLAPQPLKRRDSSGKSSTSTSAESSRYLPVVIDTERRKVIRRAIMTGEIDQAMDLLEKNYPGIITNDPEMVLQLRCRKFVEMVHQASHPLHTLDHQKSCVDNGSGLIRHSVVDTELKDRNFVEHMEVDQDNADTAHAGAENEELEGLGMLKDAIQYGQFLQEQYKDNRRQSVQEMLINAFAVLAYADVDHSGSGHNPGTRPISREQVANTVNTTILASQNLPTTAPLETLYRQTSVVMSELTRLGVGEAAFFDLDKDCLK